ncbi:MAG TPA: hypothetical protein VFO86_10630, partial [Terriglobia bacterium]|nr:hypothetical protein [Terriglobia bacterium]
HIPELETHCSELSHSESFKPDKGLAAIQTFMNSNPIETSINVWLLRRIPNPSALPLHANHQSRIGTEFHVPSFSRWERQDAASGTRISSATSNSPFRKTGRMNS